MLVLIAVVSFLPYLTLGPLAAPSQVQPWAAMLAWVWICVQVLSLGLRVTLPQVMLLVLGIWFMLHASGDDADLESILRRTGAYVLSVGLCIAAQYFSPRGLWLALKIVLPVWTVFALLRYALPSVYFSIVPSLVPTVFREDVRGSSSLAPEATDFGYTMVFLLFFCIVTREVLKRGGGRPALWPIGLAVANAVLSLSGTGIFGLAIVALIYLATRPAGRLGRLGRVVLVSLAVLIGVVLLSAIGSTGVRGLDLLILTVQSPTGLVDTTLSYRIAHNIVGLVALWESGLIGFGADSFSTVAPGLYADYRVDELLGLTGYYAQAVPLSLYQAPASQVALLLLEQGIAGLAFVVTFLVVIARSTMPYKWVGFAIVAGALIQSFPAAWPPMWIALGLATAPVFAGGTDRILGRDDPLLTSGRGILGHDRVRQNPRAVGR